ncbi:MAG: enoyl-CoA hydratase, partial [Pseudomonadota bacterium]
MSDRLLIDVHEGVAHVRLNRPDKLNALDMAMFEALAEAPNLTTVSFPLVSGVIDSESLTVCLAL